MIILSYASSAESSSNYTDVEILSAEIYYQDNISDSKKTIRRKLKSFSDNGVWSKPSKIDLEISIRNNSNNVTSVVISPALYYLLKPIPGTPFPPMKTTEPIAQELRELSKGKSVWVWNRVLASKGVRSLNAHDTMKIVFQNLDISNNYSPTSYYNQGFAVRVYVKAYKDNDYSNNVKDLIYIYPM